MIKTFMQCFFITALILLVSLFELAYAKQTSKNEKANKPPVADPSSPESAVESYVAIKNYYDMISKEQSIASCKMTIESKKAELPLLRDESRKEQERIISELQKKIKFQEENEALLSKFQCTIFAVTETRDANIKIVTFKIEGNSLRKKDKEKENDPDEWWIEELTMYGHITVRREAGEWKIDGMGFYKKQSDLDNKVELLKESIKK